MRSIRLSIGKVLRREQRGFTLVELLVAVGIIVALAAVIVPNVAKFAGRGETSAKATEWDNVQAAMDAMMAEAQVTTITGLIATDNSTNAWAALPAGTGVQPLSGFLRENPTKYFYCYDGTGKINQQNTAATACPP